MELSWICPALSLAHDLTLGIGLEAARKGSGGLRTVGNERSGVDPATFLRLYSGAERPLRGAFIKPPAMRVVVDCRQAGVLIVADQEEEKHQEQQNLRGL